MFVIAIVALLIIIMLPILSMSKDKARKSNCVVNLNQLGISTKLYVDEQGYYPDGYRETAEGIFYWFGLDDKNSIQFDKGPMHGYIKNTGILLCPAFTNIDPSIKVTCSYGINMEYVGGSPETTDLGIKDSPPARSLDIRQADKTIMFMDAAFLDSGKVTESPYFWARDFFASPASEHEARSHFRHRKVAVGVFCDGHTEDNLLPDAIADKTLKIGWPAQGICERH